VGRGQGCNTLQHTATHCNSWCICLYYTYQVCIILILRMRNTIPVTSARQPQGKTPLSTWLSDSYYVYVIQSFFIHIYKYLTCIRKINVRVTLVVSHHAKHLWALGWARRDATRCVYVIFHSYYIYIYSLCISKINVPATSVWEPPGQMSLSTRLSASRCYSMWICSIRFLQNMYILIMHLQNKCTRYRGMGAARSNVFEHPAERVATMLIVYM